MEYKFQNAELKKYRNKLIIPFLVAAVGGQAIRLIPHVEQVVPHFLLAHLTNLADVPFWSSLVEKEVQNRFPNLLPEKPINRLAAVFAITAGLGIGWEVAQASQHKKWRFDWMDCACYITGAGIYAGLMRRKIHQLENGNGWVLDIPKDKVPSLPDQPKIS